MSKFGKWFSTPFDARSKKQEAKDLAILEEAVQAERAWAAKPSLEQLLILQHNELLNMQLRVLDTLNAIRSWVVFGGILLIIGIVVAACSVL